MTQASIPSTSAFQKLQAVVHVVEVRNIATPLIALDTLRSATLITALALCLAGYLECLSALCHVHMYISKATAHSCDTMPPAVRALPGMRAQPVVGQPCRVSDVARAQHARSESGQLEVTAELAQPHAKVHLISRHARVPGEACGEH